MNPLFRSLVALAAVCAGARVIGQTALPDGAASLIAPPSSVEFRLTTQQGQADAVATGPVRAEGPGFARAWRVETKRDLSPAWAAEIRTPLTAAVRNGDTGVVRLYVRALEAADETGQGLMRVAVQKASPDYDKSLDTTVSVGREWQEYVLPFAFNGNHGAGQAEIALGFGFKRQTIEVGGVEVLHYGKQLAVGDLPKTRFSYVGREADAPWRQAALARIAQIRMSDFVIELTTADGQPARGAAVRVEQVNSAFQFGTAVALERLVEDTPDNLRYREILTTWFNAAGPENDLKWPAWAGEWDRPFPQERTLAGLRWLKERNLPARGHVLVWPGWRNLPPSIGKLYRDGKKEQIPSRVLAHIADILGATRGLLEEWDVLNEPYDNHDLMALFGPEIMVEWFKAARAALPEGDLYLNDYANHDLVADKGHSEHFFRTAKYLLEKGAPLTGLGLQGHIGGQPNPPERVLATLEAYATLGLPIRITEFDIDTDDEELQADYTRDFLILAYSHPSVVGVQHWGFWAGRHWRPRAALFRHDWSEKPNAVAYRNLVLKQWRTRLQGAVGSTGKVGGRGYHGDYVVTVELEGRRAEARFRLKAGEARTVVPVRLP